jgi:integrase
LVTLLDQFIADLQLTKSADSNTPRTYRWAAQYVEEYLASGAATLGTFGPVQFHDFGRWLITKKRISANSLRVAIRGSKAFLKWAQSRGLAPPVDLGSLALPAIPRTGAAHLTPENLTRYLEAVRGADDPIKSILLMLPFTGCRIREVCSAPLAGLGQDGGSPVMHVRRKASTISFSDVARMSYADCTTYLSPVGLNRQAMLVLSRYLPVRGGMPSSPWLFPNGLGGKLSADYCSPDSVRHELRKLRVGLGLPWLTPHKAGRHTLAMLLRSSGMALDKIADVLGHTNIETTRRSYARATPTEQAALSDSAFPGGDDRGR